ncbi:MobA/MobL family protein [Cupriavidus sp. 30B13]|uniref:MobA/MobL family protein n=1 Tax=Cupriavidus sp. 30B13 TaxID=3384241 RepID=UPI003B8EE116
MATYHLSLKSGKKGKAADHAAYISRTGKFSKAEGRSDLIQSGYGNLPDWASGDPLRFWKLADKYERVNAAAYREFEVALPRELTLSQQQQILEEFIRQEVGNKPYQFAIHAPTAALGGEAQPHSHVMYSDRCPDGIERSAEQHFRRYNGANPERGGCRKDSGGMSAFELREKLISTRKNWADIQNAALEKHGHPERVDHRSHAAREITRQPERHLGQALVKKMTPTEKEAYVKGRAQT